MAQQSASPLRLRARRSVLGFDPLEDRVQPNDMFGLGLSLLTGASPTRAPQEQPALVSTQPAPQAVAGVTEVAPNVTFDLPGLRQTTQVAQAPAFDAGVIDNVFGELNAQPSAFSLDNPMPEHAAQAPVAVDAAPAQYAGGVEVVAFSAGTRGNGGQTWMPTPLPAAQVNESLVQAIITGLNKKQLLGRPHFVTISDAGTSVTVNSYGFANAFSAGGGTNQLFNTGYFLSTAGGSPREISAANCSIVADIFMLTPTRYDSLVQCGPSTYIYFIQEVYGAFNLWMTAGYAFGPIACVYAYNDYDVNGFPNDHGSYQDLGGGFTQMVVRDGTSAPKYIFADLTHSVPPNHWAQAEYPSLITTIIGFSGCDNLNDGPALFGPGDWTGAFQYTYPPATNLAKWINFHYRNDANPFP